VYKHYMQHTFNSPISLICAGLIMFHANAINTCHAHFLYIYCTILNYSFSCWSYSKANVTVSTFVYRCRTRLKIKRYMQNVYVILAYTSGTKYVIYRTLLYILIIKATVLHVHLKISQFVNKMCLQPARSKLVNKL
jgi:hypothetical protein